MHETLTAAYIEHAAALTRYVRRRVANDTEAEEIMAGVWLRTVQALAGGQRPACMAAWLRGCARNAVVDSYRRQANRTMVPLDSMPLAGVEDMAHAVESRMMAADLFAARSLTHAQRAVLHLRFVEGCTLAETAAEMGMTLGAVKGLQQRACDGLRASGRLDIWRR